MNEPIFTTCPTCGGSGEVLKPYYQYHPYGDTFVPETVYEEVKCIECNGRGMIIVDDIDES
jgi:DnaJ-class molecular chaperone